MFCLKNEDIQSKRVKYAARIINLDQFIFNSGSDTKIQVCLKVLGSKSSSAKKCSSFELNSDLANLLENSPGGNGEAVVECKSNQ